ncbi:MAG: NAD(P)H-hydrate dehydratase [Ruthenibacterium sp.]
METVIITKEACFAHLPKRAPNTHKGDYGKLLCLCGCARYRGAAALSVLGALRSGAGVVTLAAEEIVLSSVASRILESVFLPLPDDAALLSAMKRSDAVLAGCGMEESAATAAQMHILLKAAGGTVVLDAGGLCTFAQDVTALRTAEKPLIITPHIGEMAKLAHLSIEQVLQMPATVALTFAEKTGAVVVLKSHRTLIATPNGALFENRTGNAGLARGGSGDVLAGIIASLAAQGLSAQDSAVCGVYLHGATADLCAAQFSMQGMLPEDIPQNLHKLFIENEAQT